MNMTSPRAVVSSCCPYCCSSSKHRSGQFDVVRLCFGQQTILRFFFYFPTACFDGRDYASSVFSFAWSWWILCALAEPEDIDQSALSPAAKLLVLLRRTTTSANCSWTFESTRSCVTKNTYIHRVHALARRASICRTLLHLPSAYPPYP